MNDSEWLNAHYPRCTRCSLRTYVNVQNGHREDDTTGSAGCPGWLLPETERPAFPWEWRISPHTV